MFYYPIIAMTTSYFNNKKENSRLQNGLAFWKVTRSFRIHTHPHPNTPHLHTTSSHKMFIKILHFNIHNSILTTKLYSTYYYNHLRLSRRISCLKNCDIPGFSRPLLISVVFYSSSLFSICAGLKLSTAGRARIIRFSRLVEVAARLSHSALGTAVFYP